MGGCVGGWFLELLCYRELTLLTRERERGEEEEEEEEKGERRTATGKIGGWLRFTSFSLLLSYTLTGLSFLPIQSSLCT